MHYALIKNNVVQSVILVEDPAFIDLIKNLPGYPISFDTALEVGDGSGVGIGSIYDGSTFTDPAPISEEP